LLIKPFAALLIEHTRDSDIKARIGGDEFIVMIITNSKSFIEAWCNDIALS